MDESKSDTELLRGCLKMLGHRHACVKYHIGGGGGRWAFGLRGTKEFDTQLILSNQVISKFRDCRRIT